MRNGVEDLQQTQEASSVNVQPTKQAELLQIIEYFATKICKVRKCVYLCDANRCLKHHHKTYHNAIKRCPLSTFGYAEGVGSQNLTGQRLFYCPTYIPNF